MVPFTRIGQRVADPVQLPSTTLTHITGCILSTNCQFKYITIRVIVYTYMHKTIPVQPNTDHIKNAIPL